MSNSLDPNDLLTPSDAAPSALEVVVFEDPQAAFQADHYAGTLYGGPVMLHRVSPTSLALLVPAADSGAAVLALSADGFDPDAFLWRQEGLS